MCQLPLTPAAAQPAGSERPPQSAASASAALNVLDVDQVALRLRCSAKTVQALARAGKVPGLKLGRDWVFPVDALNRALCAMAEERATDLRRPTAPVAQLVPNVGARRRSPPALPPLEGTHPRATEGGAR